MAKFSAGYDFKVAEDAVIPVFHPGVKPVLVLTGVKGKLDHYLLHRNNYLL